MAIFGSSNLSDSGDLLIFNKVSYKTLLMFEKELGRDRMTYLVEEGLPPDTATASHLESTKADGILFQAGGSDPVALRSAIMERINEGRRVVFLPGPVSHVKGSISQIPPRVIKALEALHISPVPVYAGFYTNSVLDAEADTDAQADIQIHILPKLAPGAEMAARLTSAWLECSAQAYATLPQLHGSLSALLFRSLRLHSDCRVIDGIDDTTLTYGQLLAISVAFAKRLKKITSNRRVGIILPPGKGAAIANLGCLFAGKTPVNFNYSASEGAFASSVKQSGVDWFITADTFMRKLQNFPWPPQRDLILMEREIPLLKGSAKRWGLAIKFLTAGFMIKKLGLDAPTGADEAVLMFTSGTTGRSKAVMLSEHNFFTTVECQVKFGGAMLDYKHEHMPEDKNDVLSNFAILPLFHLGTFICLFVWACKGWALNLSADIRDFYRDLGLMHSDAIAVAPMLMEAIYKDVKRGRRARLNGVWNPCGSSAMFDGAMLAELAQQGMMITQVYGMTETCGDGIINYEQDEKHIRAVGKPDDHAEYKLDETGEICIRGGCVMLGYYKDPEATAEVLDADGWFHTGDLARVDEDGFYYITGRKKNIIILDNGENVSPEELENLLSKCEAVKECIVREKGKKICAVIYCSEADQQTVRDFITETNRTLPLYKRMSAVEFSTEPLPRTGTGKLLRK